MGAIDWTPVEEAIAEDTVAGYKVALLESFKILEQRLSEERLPGSTTTDRLAAARPHLTRVTKLDKAVAYAESLRTGSTKALTAEQGKAHLQAFRQAVADLNDLGQSRDSVLAKLRLYFGLAKGKQRWLVRGLIGIGGFFVLVLLLADTAPGQLLVAGVVGLVHFFFSSILLILIALALCAVAVLGTALFLDRQGRGGGRIKEEEDDDQH